MSNLRVCADEECGATFEFDPSVPQRIYCYKPRCKARRRARNNQVKMGRVKQLKAEGKWIDHLNAVKGVGKGALRFTPKVESRGQRQCLKCDRVFDVPATSDDHICHDCHVENDELLVEYTEEALGLKPFPPTSSMWGAE